MIQIRLDKGQLEQLVLKHKRGLLSAPYNIDGALITLLNKYRIADISKFRFYWVLFFFSEQLLFYPPKSLDELRQLIEPFYDRIINQINAKLLNRKAKKGEIIAFRKEIYSAFNYDLFSRNYSGYGAYELTRSLKVNVCPYCNRMSTNTIFTKNGKTRARLDHWFDKARYPYFALSFYNLIPSCQVCNSDLKNSKKFILNDYVHPYISGFETDYSFKTDITKATYKTGNPDSFKITLAPKNTIDIDFKRKIENNLLAFCIEEIYNCHKEIAAEIIEESDEYSSDYLDFLLSLKSPSGVPLYLSKQNIIEKKFRIKMNIEDLGKEVFSKFKRDIAIEQGLEI